MDAPGEQAQSSQTLSRAAGERLWKVLFAPPPEDEEKVVFALLDGATVRQLPDFLEDEESEHAPLVPLKTNEPEEVTRAAYLTRVERGSRVAEWLATEGWGRHWGIFICAPPTMDLDDVLRHLRELSQVRLPDGRIVYFRFYDPRVWRVFASTCDSEQAQQLFHLPLRYACESADGRELLIDRLIKDKLERQSVLLEEPEDGAGASQTSL